MNKPINNTLFAEVEPAPTPKAAPSLPPVQPDSKALALVELLATAAKLKPNDDEETFNWQRDKADIIIKHQPAIAVYIGGAEHVVIRQEHPDGSDEDGVILTTLENLPILIERLQTFLPAKAARGSR